MFGSRGRGGGRPPPMEEPPGRARPMWLSLLLFVFMLPCTADGSSVLNKGVSRNGLVAGGGSKFYKLQLSCPSAAAQLQLSLSPLQGGAPSLYVSTSLQQPGVDSGWTWLGNSSAPISLAAPSAGMYYLSVTSANASAFRLLASVTLASGVFQRGLRWQPVAAKPPRMPCLTLPHTLLREPAVPRLPNLRRRHSSQRGRERGPALLRAERLHGDWQHRAPGLPHGALPSLPASTPQCPLTRDSCAGGEQPAHGGRRSAAALPAGSAGVGVGGQQPLLRGEAGRGDRRRRQHSPACGQHEQLKHL